jgi:hypothetical protein
MTTYIDGNLLGSVQMMPDEITYVENLIRDLPIDGKMVEWGSGGSTVHWLNELKETQTLISIEHNSDWYNKVKNSIGEKNNFKYFFADTSSIHHDHGYGGVNEENPFNTASYVNPTSEIYDADLFFIDGIARGACLATVLLKRTKKDSIILIHDYELRKMAYNWITQFCTVKKVGETLVNVTA